MANNILDIPETPEEWKQKAQEAFGDPIAAIMKDVFQKEHDDAVMQPDTQARKAEFLARLQNGTAKNVVTASSLEFQPTASGAGETFGNLAKPVDKADEKMEAQLLSSSKVYGPNEVALIRSNDPTVIAQAQATADRMQVDCIIGTKDGLILHGHTPAMEATRASFGAVMEGNLLPTGENTNIGALANGVVGQYRNESWMEVARESGIVEKPGVSYTLQGAVEVSQAANLARAMQNSGVHNPAVVSASKDGNGYIMLDTHNPVAQSMIAKHTPAGQAEGLAQFKFDSREDMARFLTEMSDVQHAMDARDDRGDDTPGLDESEVGALE